MGKYSLLLPEVLQDDGLRSRPYSTLDVAAAAGNTSPPDSDVC